MAMSLLRNRPSSAYTSCGEDSEAGGLRRREWWRRCAYERENHPAHYRVGDNSDQKGDGRIQKGRAM